MLRYQAIWSPDILRMRWNSEEGGNRERKNIGLGCLIRGDHQFNR